MRREEFLARLRRGLAGLPRTTIEETLADYAAHFEEARTAGRSEEEVAQALGNPERLARELRAEVGLRHWETHRTPGALLVAIGGLGALLALDVFILLPVLCVAGALALVAAIVLLSTGLTGFGLMIAGLLHGMVPFGILSGLSRTLAGIGLMGGSIGFAALGWLLLEAIARALGRYARLHYQVLRTSEMTA